MGKTSFQPSIQETAAKPASSVTVPRASSAPGGPRKVPLMRVSHTPRSIRLAGAPGRAHHAVKPKWANRHNKPSSDGDDGPSTSKAIIRYRGRGPVEVWHELPPNTMYMDPWGHGHGSLQDGGLIYMDPFGHCHEKLNDGGFLYMDRQGSCHLTLDDDIQPRKTRSHPLPHQSFRAHRRMSLEDALELADGRKLKAEQAVHGTDLRMVQDKSAVHDKAATRSASHPNQRTRRAHGISQPRRHN